MPAMRSETNLQVVGELSIMKLIWVYGTLKRNHGNHQLLEASTFLGKATSEPVFTMLHLGGFPGIIRGGETPISGELYEVDDDTLKRLDRLEGHPNFYRREPITVRMDDGTVHEVEGYVLPAVWRDQTSIITSGIWGKS